MVNSGAILALNGDGTDGEVQLGSMAVDAIGYATDDGIAGHDAGCG